MQIRLYIHGAHDLFRWQSTTDYLQSTGDWPIDNAQAGLALGTEISGSYTDSVWVGTDGTSAVIAISYSGPPEIAGKSIVLHGTGSAGAVTWTCTGGTLPARFRPPVCRI